MKRERKLTRFRRFSASPNSSLPPLTPSSHTHHDPTYSNPHTAYSIITDQEKNTGQKFFTAKPPQTCQSINPEDITSRTLPTTQDFYTPLKLVDHSDITERIESYELRAKKIFTVEALEENLYLWEKCLNDVMPEVKKYDLDIRRGLVQICMHFLENSKNILKLTASQKLSDQLVFDNLKKTIVSLKNERKNHIEEINELKAIKKLEMEQIEKELEEIFGKNDKEINSLRLRAKELRDVNSVGTSNLLMEIWNSMNQDFDIPDLKNEDFTGLDPSEIPLMLSKKFTLIQKFTAKRIADIINSKKNTDIKTTQTTGEYIDPKAFEEQAKNIEKLHYQLNSAFISIDRYRENFGSKINILETLEIEKNSLSAEVGRLKKDLDMMSSTISKANYDNKKIASEFESIRKDKERLQKEKNSCQLEIIDRDKKLQERQSSIDKLVKTIEDKDDKIFTLERQLAKRRIKTDKPEEGPEASKSLLKPQSKFDEKAFMDSIKSSSSKRRDSSNNNQPPPYRLNESYLTDNTTKSNLITSNPSSSIQTSVKTTKTGSRSNSPSKNRPLKRLSSIEEASSPTSISSQETGPISIKNRQNKLGEKANSIESETKSLKPKEKTKNRPSTRNVENNTHEYESLDEYEIGIKHEDYLDRNSYYEDSQNSYSNEHKNTYSNMNTKSTSTNEFSYMNTIDNSKSVQFNGITLDIEEEQSNKDSIHMFPYNPNQYYGLKGDTFYHSRNAVFLAHPRIPDIKDSITFQSPYILKK
ncbi:hypothetical protein SteCoe_7959 [Stentor coeruleus]|uniref:Uncharacterized protein n=1 Tax=Stentor coeruleus TaxID=5963 RepID=A0A1R2CLF0_9CILI|nr:hypothetical protein SteCoe_7959 [Stentor coeruleus]